MNHNFWDSPLSMIAVLLILTVFLGISATWISNLTAAKVQQGLVTNNYITGTIIDTRSWTTNIFLGIGTSPHDNITVQASDDHTFSFQVQCTYYQTGMQVPVLKTNGYLGIFGYMNSTVWSYSVENIPWGC